jgi:hypothetical protein
MGAFEIAGVGITSNNLNYVIENYSFADCLYMMAVSFAVFFIIGIYLENVLPSKYGLRKPFYFFLTKSYWFGERHLNAKIEHKTNISLEDIEKHEFIE